MFTNENRQKAHNEIDYIFTTLFPAHSMAQRPEQIHMSHWMLDAMLDGRIALCDAGTGIGKTFAYLAAGVAFQHCRAAEHHPFRSVVISTSSVALQNAIIDEYIPFLSQTLLEDGQIDRPLEAVVRKGRSRYVCDMRLERRLRRSNLSGKSPRTAAALLALRNRLDMDLAPHLSSFDRERVCVPRLCDCKTKDCRYRRFLDRCRERRYDFQICNHNLFLADAIHRSIGQRPILPERAALVIDEAHKLPETARQMFGVTLLASDFETVAHTLRAEKFLLAAENLMEISSPLTRKMLKTWDERNGLEPFLGSLVLVHRCLQVIQKQVGRELSQHSRRKLAMLDNAVSLFCDSSPDMIFYTAPDERGGTMLCATVANLTAQMRRAIWSQPDGMVLTSGTLAAGGSFRRYKEETGLLADQRVCSSVYGSPFEYRQNCLLYLPQNPPIQKSKRYLDRLADEIIRLVTATRGHALVLFTAYNDLTAVRKRLSGRGLPFPLFTMGRNALYTVEQFKDSGNGVLLAAGPAWEGVDFPGDCVSLLVIPRLPFPYPDELKEREREKYERLQDFIRQAVVPDMQIKLRQGFGRAIRTETDTCVVAILDDRAVPEGRYHADTLEALPEMPMTRSLKEVKRFIRNVKRKEYFQRISQSKGEAHAAGS